jgi:hypothetical protein
MSNLTKIDPNYFDQNEHVIMMKSLFYFLSPEETYYEHAEQVPNLTAKVKRDLFFFL